MEKGKTFADLPKPQGTDGVNTHLMIQAWDLNVQTQRDMIAQMERTRRDNKRTRAVVYSATAALIASVVWIHVRSDEVSTGMHEVVEVATEAAKRLESVERKLNAVADAVVATNEAEVIEAEAQAAELGAIKATIAAPTSRARRVAAAPEPEVVEVKRMARVKRVEAQAKAVKAKVELATHPKERARAKAKLAEIEQEAEAAGIDAEF